MSSSTTYTYTLSPTAYSLPLLHAASNPSSTVQGCFLASTSAESSSASTTTTTGSGRRPLLISHAIPLVHAQTSLTPMIEAGIEHIEVYAAKQGLSIVGMYEISETKALSRAGKGLLSGLKKSSTEVFALTVDVSQLGTGGNPYVMTLSSDPSKLLQPTSAPLSTPGPSASAQTLKLIREDKAHQLVKDWDDHMDDSSVEWLANKTAVEAIAKRVKQ